MKLKLWIILILITACERRDKEVSQVDYNLIKGHDLKNAKILYQYYEKFGFTDICVHTRSYFIDKSFIINKSWQKLPISKKDIARINGIANKVDTLNGRTLNVIYRLGDYYSDISIKRQEYLSDSTFNTRIELNNGFYKISETTFEIYNSENKTIYYEYHGCP